MLLRSSGCLLPSAYCLPLSAFCLLPRRVRPVNLNAGGELLGDLVRDVLAEEHRARLAAGDDLHRARVEDGEGEAARERLARNLDEEGCVRVAARQDHAPRLKLLALAQRVFDLSLADEDRVRVDAYEARRPHDRGGVCRARAHDLLPRSALTLTLTLTLVLVFLEGRVLPLLRLLLRRLRTALRVRRSDLRDGARRGRRGEEQREQTCRERAARGDAVRGVRRDSCLAQVFHKCLLWEM